MFSALEIILSKFFTGTVQTGNVFTKTNFDWKRYLPIYGSQSVLRDHIFSNVASIVRNSVPIAKNLK